MNRKLPQRLSLAAAVTSAVLIAIAQPAVGAILTNGDFESGSLSGWTETDQAGGSGSWFASTPGSPTPLSGIGTSPNGGDPHGTTYAVTDQTGPGSHALTQTFAIGPSLGVILRWDMFINDSDSGPQGTGLDFTNGPQQIGRVDILSSVATAFDVGAGVLQNCFIMTSPSAPVQDFATNTCDITAAVGAGGTFQVRFGETDNQFFFNMGIDNVSITARDQQVPEPATLALLGLGLAGLGFNRRKR